MRSSPRFEHEGDPLLPGLVVAANAHRHRHVITARGVDEAHPLVALDDRHPFHFVVQAEKQRREGPKDVHECVPTLSGRSVGR